MLDEPRLVFCSLDELKKKRRITKWVEELKDELTALYLSSGQVVVTSSVCLHMGGEFDVDWDKNQLRCRWHGWKFDVDTGQCLSYSLPGRKLPRYKFIEKDGQIEVVPPQYETI